MDIKKKSGNCFCQQFVTKISKSHLANTTPTLPKLAKPDQNSATKITASAINARHESCQNAKKLNHGTMNSRLSESMNLKSGRLELLTSIHTKLLYESCVKCINCN